MFWIMFLFAVTVSTLMTAINSSSKNKAILFAFVSGVNALNMCQTAQTFYKDFEKRAFGRYVITHKGEHYTCENQRNGRYCLDETGVQVIINEADWQRAQKGE